MDEINILFFSVAKAIDRQQYEMLNPSKKLAEKVEIVSFREHYSIRFPKKKANFSPLTLAVYNIFHFFFSTLF